MAHGYYWFQTKSTQTSRCPLVVETDRTIEHWDHVEWSCESDCSVATALYIFATCIDYPYAFDSRSGFRRSLPAIRNSDTEDYEAVHLVITHARVGHLLGKVELQGSYGMYVMVTHT